MTGVELAKPYTAAWYEHRRAGIGASEIAAVMGISPWESPFSLYWRKVNGWELETTEEMAAGIRLEPVIADWWADEGDPHENLTVVASGLLANHRRPWQMATPDRLIHEICRTCEGGALPPDWYGCSDCMNTQLGSPPLAVLECKYVAHSWDGWGEPGTDQIPVHYRAQVQWQCDVVDVHDWYLAVLGPGGFREYHGRRDDRDLTVMVEYGRRFMTDLAAGTAPALDDHAATLAAMRRLHPDLDDVSVEVPADLAAGYARAVRMAKLADRVKARYETRLRDAMGRARRATSDGRKVATHVISDIDEATITRAAHRRDYLLPAKERTPS